MSMLKNLSGQRLILHTDACREPHWHTNANKIVYCCVSFQILIYLNFQKQDVFFFLQSGIALVTTQVKKARS
jgi:hypothetical protein